MPILRKNSPREYLRGPQPQPEREAGLLREHENKEDVADDDDEAILPEKFAEMHDRIR